MIIILFQTEEQMLLCFFQLLRIKEDNGDIFIERWSKDWGWSVKINKPYVPFLTSFTCKLCFQRHLYILYVLLSIFLFKLYFIFDFQIKRMQFSLKSIILTIALILLSQSCQPNNVIADFWSCTSFPITATASFIISTNESTSLALSYQTYNITLPRKYDRNSNIQYAFALKDMDVLSSSIIYFDLLVLKTFESSVVINFIYEPNKWAKVSYNYWISFRTDIFLGISTYTQNDIVKGKENYQITYLIRQQNLPKKAIGVVFLNGLRVDTTNQTEIESHIDFTIQTQYLKDGQLIFTFLYNNPHPLSSITFSYAVYSPHQIPLTSYGGIISQTSLTSMKFKDARYILPQGNSYSIFGISSISTNNSFTFTSNLYQNYTLAYGVNSYNFVDNLEITYIIIGQNPANLCLRNTQCQQSLSFNVQGGSCVSSCPSSSKVVTFVDGSVECVPCAANMLYSNITKKCICAAGYVLQSKGVCTLDVQASGVSNARISSGDSLDSPATSECFKIVNTQQNNKNLFLTIQASNVVLQDPQSINKNYVQLTFPDSLTQASSFYCSISDQDVTQYNCLLLYTLGIPTKPFSIVVTCALQGDSCSSSQFTYAPKGQ